MLAWFSGLFVGFGAGAVLGYLLRSPPEPKPLATKVPVQCKRTANGFAAFAELQPKESTPSLERYDAWYKSGGKLVCGCSAEYNCEGGYCIEHCQMRCNSECPCKIVNKEKEQ